MNLAVQWLSSQSLPACQRGGHVGFLVDVVALRQGVCLFFPASIIQPFLYLNISIRRTKLGTVHQSSAPFRIVGRKSRESNLTLSHFRGFCSSGTKRSVIIQRNGIFSYAGMKTSKLALTSVMPQPDSSGEGVRHQLAFSSVPILLLLKHIYKINEICVQVYKLVAWDHAIAKAITNTRRLTPV